MSELPPKPVSVIAVLYQPRPPIRYGETPVEGISYTRFPVTLVKCALPPPPLMPNWLYAPSIRIPSGIIVGLNPSVAVALNPVLKPFDKSLVGIAAPAATPQCTGFATCARASNGSERSAVPARATTKSERFKTTPG